MIWLDRLLEWFRPRHVEPVPAEIAPFDEAALIALHNDERMSKELPPLIWDPVLSSMATSRAAHAAAELLPPGHLHDGFEEAIRDVRVDSGAAENAAMGQKDARSAMRSWLASTPHRANILDREFTRVGAGRSISADDVPYWYVIFAG